jgi:hypothetical protein
MNRYPYRGTGAAGRPSRERSGSVYPTGADPTVNSGGFRRPIA